jgi:hypothetical protein
VGGWGRERERCGQADCDSDLYDRNVRIAAEEKQLQELRKAIPEQGKAAGQPG